MALLDRVRERTGSDLSDGELQSMIDGITDEIALLFGPAGPITVEIGDPADPFTRETRTIRLLRPLDPTQDVTIVETWPGNSGLAQANLTLDPSDYLVMHGGRTLQRRVSGVHGRPHWASLVTVTYTPLGEQSARDEAVIKIMQIDLSCRGGIRSERAGDYSLTLSSNPAADRQAVFDGLANRRGMVMS